MKYSMHIILLLFFYILNTWASAQTAQVDGPVIAPLGSNFSYTMDLIPNRDESSTRKSEKILNTNPAVHPSGELDQATITHWEISKWEGVTAISIQNKAGQNGEIWMKGDLKIVRPPEGTGFYLDKDPPQKDRFRVDLVGDRYPHAVWITPESYVRKVKFNGSDALYFCRSKENSSSPEKVQSTSSTPYNEAWIDIHSRNPICIREGGVIYSFQVLPPKTLELPNEVLSIVTNESNAMTPFTSEIQGHLQVKKAK